MRDDENATFGAPPRGVAYFPRAFSDEFLARIDAAREAAPVSLASQNMAAERRFIRDEVLARDIARAMPSAANIDVVCSDIRFIDYDAGGFILPHVDGVRVCDATGVETDASVLVFLTTVPPGEGGETEFLRDVQRSDEEDVLFSVRPIRGGMLVFDHACAHVGRCVGVYPKILLRLDAKRKSSAA